MPPIYKRDGEPVAGSRFDPFDLLVSATTLATRVAKATYDAIDFLDDRLREHANWRRERRDFAQTAQDTIDRL